MINKFLFFFTSKNVCCFSIAIIFFFSCSTTSKIEISTKGHIVPKNNAEIYQTVLLLEYPPIEKATNYIVEIVGDDCPNFEGNCQIQKLESQSLTVLSKDFLEFGKVYKWRVNAFDKQNKIHTSPIHTFWVATNERVDAQKYRNIVTENTKQFYFGNGGVFLDTPGVMIDENGKPIWFTKPLNEKAKGGSNVCGKILPNGNFSYLSDKYYETDLFGNIVFESGDSLLTEDGKQCLALHHSYTLMPNGNILALSAMKNNYKVKEGDFDNRFLSIADSSYVTDFELGLIVEIDRQTNEIVWSYNLADYIGEQNQLQAGNLIGNGHLNAVFYDEKEDCIWISARDLCRILKIDRKTKKVVKTIGAEMPYGKADIVTNDFHWQHSAELDGDGNLFLYNNSTGEGKDTISSAVKLKLGSENSEKIWEFKCDFGNKRRSLGKTKGDVDLLENGNYLIAMGYNPRTIIVDDNKKVLWTCVHESYRKPIKNLIDEQGFVHWVKVEEPEKEQWLPITYNYSVSWNPTLYPNYFTCELKSNRGKTNLVIHNEGFLPNTIDWEIINANKSLADKSLKEGTLELNKRETKTINGIDLAEGKYKVVLSSKNIFSKPKEYDFEVSVKPKQQ